MYIGGSWVTTEEKRPVINPADESTVAEVPEAGAEQAEMALEAARNAQRAWARRSGGERGAAARGGGGGARRRGGGRGGCAGRRARCAGGGAGGQGRRGPGVVGASAGPLCGRWPVGSGPGRRTSPGS